MEIFKKSTVHITLEEFKRNHSIVDEVDGATMQEFIIPKISLMTGSTKNNTFWARCQINRISAESVGHAELQVLSSAIGRAARRYLQETPNAR